MHAITNAAEMSLVGVTRQVRHLANIEMLMFDGTLSRRGCVAWEQRGPTFSKQRGNKVLSDVYPDYLT